MNIYEIGGFGLRFFVYGASIQGCSISCVPGAYVQAVMIIVGADASAARNTVSDGENGDGMILFVGATFAVAHICC